MDYTSTVGQGVFANSSTNHLDVRPMAGGAGSYFYLNFDASKSSSIYKASGKVRPLSFSTIFIIKAY